MLIMITVTVNREIDGLEVILTWGEKNRKQDWMWLQIRRKQKNLLLNNNNKKALFVVNNKNEAKKDSTNCYLINMRATIHERRKQKQARIRENKNQE